MPYKASGGALRQRRVARELQPIVFARVARRLLEIDYAGLCLGLQQQVDLPGQATTRVREPDPEPALCISEAVLGDGAPQLQRLDHFLRALALLHLVSRLGDTLPAMTASPSL